MEMALHFGTTNFDIVDHNGNPWIQARQLGEALGYSRSDAILNIYERNKDEFSPDMTTTIELMVGVNLTTPTKTRIFSLRGCHLLAMFARTPVAKAFRKWVLDVLDRIAKEETPGNTPAPETSEERARRLAKERQLRFKERKRLALEGKAADKYAGYMEKVEAFRATTMKGIDSLVSEGIGLMDVTKFGAAAFTPYSGVLVNWLMEVITQPSALYGSGWRDVEYAINNSPVGLVRELERMLTDMRK